MPVRRRGGSWYVEFQYRGVRVRKSADEALGKKASRDEALAYEMQLREELAGQPQRHLPTFGQLASAKLIGWQSYLATDRRQRRHWDAVASFIASVPVDRCVDAAAMYAHDAQKRGLAPATINRRLALIRKLARTAYESGLTAAPNYKHIEFLPENNIRGVYLREADVEALARAAGEEDAEAERAILLAAFTGLPAQELLSLCQEDVTTSGDIAFPRGGKRTTIPIPQRYKHLLVPLPIRLTADQLRRRFEKARSKAGMPNVQFRDLRQTYIRWLIKTGLAPELVRELAGLRSPDSLKRHKEVSDAIERLGKL